MRTLLLLVTLLTCCASFKSTWVGKDAEAVVDKFGVPNNRMEFKDSELWEYISDCGGNSMTTVTNGVPFTGHYSSCTHRTFKIKDGKVIDAKKTYK